MLGPNNKKKKREKLSKDSIQRAKKLFSYLKPYRGLFTIGWVFLVLSSSIGLLFPILMGQLLGVESEQSSSMQGALNMMNVNNVTTYAIALFIMFATQSFFSFFRVVIFTNVTENALRDIRKDAFKQLIYMPMDFFNKNKVGELTSRLSADIEKLQETMRTTVAEFFRQLVMIAGSVTFLLYISPKLALIMLATVPVMAIIAVFFGRFIKKLSKKAQDEAAASNGVIEESLMGISNVKSFTNELFMLGKYVKSVTNIRALNVKSGLWRGVFISFLIFCMSGAIVIVVWQGLLMTQGANPELSRGDFFTCMLLTIMMGMSFGSIPDMYSSIQKAIGATENLMNIIYSKNEKNLLTGTNKPIITGKISFSTVSFSYPQRKDIEVLKGINFNITKNQTIALVGPSGAGKSTIASLLFNYYPITGGTIQFDGVSITDIEIEHLRSHMAIVPQEVILFGGSIKENIVFGKLDATAEQIIEAAKQANAWEFISTFPDGLETEVGDRGIQLSGGQKQRIAIARAILRDPKILILDEATSALDSESEKLVQEALTKLMAGRTSFVIAHRLSTIRKADNIFVIDEGIIKEAGRHDDLITSNGIYANLVDLQGVSVTS
ncbi:MAG: ABC transporter transmembrane domain-containing protein [Crocinitomicaceae bacterium]